MSSDWVAPRGGNQSNAQWGRNDLQEKFYKVRPSPPPDISFPLCVIRVSDADVRSTDTRRDTCLHNGRPPPPTCTSTCVSIIHILARISASLSLRRSLSIYPHTYLTDLTPRSPSSFSLSPHHVSLPYASTLSPLLLPLSPPHIPTLRASLLPRASFNTPGLVNTKAVGAEPVLGDVREE